MLKLVRLARMPRLIKLLNEQRFKRVLTQFDGPRPNIEEIQQRAMHLGIYKVLRLILIMCLMIYGVACIFFLMANMLL